VSSERSSPFLDLIGPLWTRTGEGGQEFGFVLEERHCNSRGTVHGGVLCTLVDVTLGYTTAFSTDPPTRLTTANMSVDFVGSAVPGDLVVARAEITRIGRRLAFASASVDVEDRPVVRASGVFAVAS
jgi:acyl-coenzyme A thioesterase 13